jgi:CheY-like chemotaxis protein
MSDVASPRKLRVLILDDEDKVARAIARSVAGEYDTEVMTRPLEALARIQAGETFDVILCDLTMPDMSGVDFCSAVTRVAPSVGERIIFMTGGVPTLRARYFLEGSAKLCIEKPFDVEQLRQLIASASQGAPSEPRPRPSKPNDAPISSK